MTHEGANQAIGKDQGLMRERKRGNPTGGGRRGPQKTI